MKMRIALLALCAGTVALVQTNMARAATTPVPGVDVVVHSHPAGLAITVGNCQSSGGKVVKLKGQWVCTGLPATKKSGKALPQRGTGDRGSTKGYQPDWVRHDGRL